MARKDALPTLEFTFQEDSLKRIRRNRGFRATLGCFGRRSIGPIEGGDWAQRVRRNTPGEPRHVVRGGSFGRAGSGGLLCKPRYRAREYGATVSPSSGERRHHGDARFADRRQSAGRAFAGQQCAPTDRGESGDPVGPCPPGGSDGICRCCVPNSSIREHDGREIRCRETRAPLEDRCS